MQDAPRNENNENTAAQLTRAIPQKPQHVCPRRARIGYAFARMTDLPQSPAPFGKYLLDREIARGGMSRVFRARLRGPGGFEKTLVVKQILPELARDQGFVELFVKEANTLVQMSHPGLVPVYELGVVDGVYFLAMEWVEGATIAEILQSGPLPDALVAQIGAEIAEALRYAHERFEIVHRDVTPRNVIIDDAGHARLLDFGIAAKVAHTGLGGQGELFGSPGYMAPEQLRGEALGPESDLFSLGAVLYEAASGKPALPRTTTPDAASVRVAALPNLETTLAELIARALEPARTARPQSAGEVAGTLRRWLAERHPQGVERELALRAQEAHARRPSEVNLLSAAPHESSGRIEVRSIATSPVLDELLKLATERIERELPSPPPRPPADPELPLMADPEAQATVRRYARDLLVLIAALIVGIYWTVRHPRAELAEGVAADGSIGPVLTKTQSTHEPPGPPTLIATHSSAANTARTSTDAGANPATNAPRTTAPADAAAPSASSESAKPGFLTISASPWADVRIDGRVLGVTPRRHVAVAPGKHTLNLACPPLGRQARVQLELHAGQSVQVLVDLHEDPAKVVLK